MNEPSDGEIYANMSAKALNSEATRQIMRDSAARLDSLLNLLEALDGLAYNFQGIDLKYRREGVDWPKPWQAKRHSCKHEWARQVAYGDTPEEAIVELARLAKNSSA